MRTPGLLIAGVLSAACGASPLNHPVDRAAPDVGAPAGDASTEPDAGAPETTADVQGYEAALNFPTALVTPAELASTPRADVNLELLALKLSPGKIVADQATYDRVVRDVGAIRARNPALARIGFFSYNDGRTVGLRVTVETGAQMQAGSYRAWDCLNETYGAAMPFDYIRFDNADEVFVYFKMRGNYSTLLLAEEYGKLPGVTHSEGNGFGGDGPTICATRGATTWHYVFDDASGDCPAGCIDHAYRHFTTEPDGAVMDLGSWDSKGGTPRPEWAMQYAASGTCH